MGLPRIHQRWFSSLAFLWKDTSSFAGDVGVLNLGENINMTCLGCFWVGIGGVRSLSWLRHDSCGRRAWAAVPTCHVGFSPNAQGCKVKPSPFPLLSTILYQI